MKIDLFYINIEKDIEDLSFLSLVEQEKVLKIHNKIIAQQTLQGKYLLYYYLKQKCNINEKLQLNYNANGKPFFKNSPIYFSISHCDKTVAAAFCDFPIGLDIENKIKNSSTLLKRIFNTNELKMVYENSENFLKIFTAKEAVVKLFGLTLMPGFQKIKFENDKLFYQNNAIPFIHFQLNDKTCCIACEHGITELELNQISLD